LFEKKGVKAGARDTENENLLAEYRNKISELTEKNKLLKQRVIVSQQQVQAAQQMKKSSTIYDGVSSRIDTVKTKILFEINSMLFFKGSTKTNAITIIS